VTSYFPPDGFEGRFYTDVAARSAYSEGAGPYRIVPAAVALPAHEHDVTLLVREAVRGGWHLTPRGAGSGMPGGNVGPGVVVDTRALARPPVVDSAGCVTTGAAVTWAAIDTAAEAHGLRLPPNPSSGRFCTAGGMVAANAAGARSVASGSIRPWVSSLRMVAGDGETVRLERGAPVPDSGLRARLDREAHARLAKVAPLLARFPRTAKNSSGYALDAYHRSGDLLDLVVGSEGTLGIVTEVTFALERRPEAVAGVLLGLGRLDGLGDVVARLLALEPAAVELLDASFLTLASARVALPGPDLAAVLLVDFERESPEMAAEATAKAVERCRPWCPVSSRALEPAAHDRLWELRHAASPSLAALPDSRRSLQMIEDGCVPIAHLGTYVDGVRQIAAEFDIEIVAFGHAGDGHLHVNALVDTTQTDLERRLAGLLDGVTDLVLRLGGTPSGEHGDGRLRTAAVARLYGAELIDLFRVVKRAFDPHRVLNPGVILGEPHADAVASLKVGPAAAAIPDAVARGLRHIERTGAWETPPLDLLRDANPR
jgi:FAD/FMN-containing dehydrogenase